MKVKDVIAALSGLDPELYVVGYRCDEDEGLFSGVSVVRTANHWHDALPVGERYVKLEFYDIFPHVRGEWTFAEKVPPDLPPEYLFGCQYCGFEETATTSRGCPNCPWRPMLRRKEV